MFQISPVSTSFFMSTFFSAPSFLTTSLLYLNLFSIFPIFPFPFSLTSLYSLPFFVHLKFLPIVPSFFLASFLLFSFLCFSTFSSLSPFFCSPVLQSSFLSFSFFLLVMFSSLIHFYSCIHLFSLDQQWINLTCMVTTKTTAKCVKLN